MNFEDNARLFLEEARELLAGLEKGFLELEEHPEREELVHDIFRSLHTIKGSGGMFGFDSVSEFTHDVENLFDDVRKGIVAVDARVTGIGLRAVDCIADLIDDPEPGGEAAAIRAEIAAIRGQGCQPARAEVALRPLAAPAEAATGAAPSSRPGSTAPGEPSGRGLPHVYRIVFAPIEAILHRGVKLELLFQELGELGACHATCDWEGLPRLEDLDPSMIHLSWTFTLTTPETLQAVRSVFMFVEDYATVEVTEVTPPDEAGEAGVPLLGEVLASRGLIEPEAIEEIRRGQVPFGEVAVSKGQVSRLDLEGALVEQRMVKSVSAEREARQESSTIRVQKEKLDFLVDAVGELVILQARLAQEARKSGLPAFEGLAENLGRLATTLRDSSMGIRMVPLGESFTSF